MKPVFLLLFALLLLVPTPASVAQEATGPRILQIYRDRIHSGRESAYEELEIQAAQAAARADSPAPYLTMSSMSGPSEAWYLVWYDSYLHMEETADSFFRNTALSAELNRILRSKGDLISGSDTIFAQYRPELSYGSDTGPLRARFYAISTVRILPGHDAEFVEFRRNTRLAHQKANEPVSHSVYEVVSGMPDGTFITLTPLAALRDVNLGLELLGEPGKTFRQATISSETQIFAIRPPMSYAAQAWLAADPEFWTTNAAARPLNDSRRPGATRRP